MSLEKGLEIIPGYRGGRKTDQQTGEAIKGEYSFYLEQAEKFIRQVRRLQEQIKSKGKEVLPGRENSNSETLDEIWSELQDCEDVINHWSTAKDKKEKLQAYMAKLEREIADAAANLGIPELEKQMMQLKKQAEFLVTHDQMIDMALRNMPEDRFLEINI